MVDYLNKLQRALGDKARRSALKAAAGVAALIGLGFLIAALWSWLAWYLMLGPALASLIIGGGFLLAALVVLSLSNAERHPMPTSTELKEEVNTRLSAATDAVLDKARFKAEETMGNAQARVASLIGLGRSRKSTGTEAPASDDGGAARVADQAAEALSEAKETLDRAVQSRVAPAVGLAGAFVIGLALAAALRGGRSEEDLYFDDDDEEDDFDEDGQRRR